MRVALFPSAFHPHMGGIEETTRQLAHCLVTRGPAPIICTHRWPRDLPSTEVVEGLSVRRFRFLMPERDLGQLVRFAPRVPRTRRLVRAALQEHGTEVIHVQGVSVNGAYALHAARSLELPLVVTLQGELTMDATRVYERSAAHRRVLNVLLREADAVTACSRHTLDEAQSWAGIDLGRRGNVVHNGVDLSAFEGPLGHRPHGRPYIAALGRLVHEKGFDVLIEAFAKIADRHRQLDLLIAGEGPLDDALEAAAAASGVGDRVRLVGRLDRAGVATFLRHAEIFVLPSRHEPFGIVNVEAMAADLPIVATEVGGVPELLSDDGGSMLVPGSSPEALAAGIASALDQPRPTRGDRKARLAQFRWGSITDQYRHTYAIAAAGKAGAGAEAR